LFESPPLTIVTRSGTATLQHSLGNGFAWDFNPLACGELAASTFLPWVRPFLLPPASGDTAPAINDSTLIVELIRVVSRPRLSVCLAVTSGVASVVTLRHNLEVKGSPASLLAARLGDSLRKHDNEDRKALLVEGSDSSPLRFKVFLGVGALFRGGGVDKTLGFVERLALQSLGVASPAAVLAAVSLADPQPPFSLPLRCYKPAAELVGDNVGIVPVLLGAAAAPTSLPLSKSPLPAPGSALSAAEAAEAVKRSLRAAVAGADAVLAVAPSAGEVQGSGTPAAEVPAGGLSARVLCAASQKQVHDAVSRLAPNVDAAELVAEWAAQETDEKQNVVAASHVASVSAVHLPPALPLADGAVATGGSADVDSAHLWATKPTFPLLASVTQLFPLPPALARDVEAFNTASEEALRLAPTSVTVASLLANAGG
jgi:hypothetical protein